MKIAIMQPYFLPYIGYFQLMNAVDEFIVYDDIEFTRKGWINRNRILVSGSSSYITLPLRKDSDYMPVKERYLADSWKTERRKMLNRIRESYRKAPMFDAVFPIVENCIMHDEENLFSFIFNSLGIIRTYLDIRTPLIVSSTLSVKKGLKAEEKVIDICNIRGAQTYINPIGGIGLYMDENFARNNIELLFHKTDSYQYRQFNHEFVEYLSIIDELMFNSRDKVREHLDTRFTLTRKTA